VGHCRAAAAATTSASVRPSIVMRSRATDGRSASKCPGEWPDQTLDQRSRLGAQYKKRPHRTANGLDIRPARYFCDETDC
jgi:hypothetical protein